MHKFSLQFILFIFLFSTGYCQSANWSAVKPDFFPTNVSGQIHGLSRVSQLKFHPSNANKMYAISARGGLFITTNAGTTWAVAPGTDFMPNARLASVCIDHTNDQILYLGTGDHNYYYSGSGVWKSTNGGTTFTQLGLNNRLVVDMIMDPLDNNKIVAVTDAGIYKTLNAGALWTLKTASRPFDEIKQKAPTSRVLYASTTDSAFFRSTDFGETWAQITSGIVLPAGVTNGNGCRLAVSASDSNIVYLGMVANGGILYKSTNGGTSFTAIKTAISPYLTYYTNTAGDNGQGDYNFGLGVDRTNPNIVYMVAHVVWKSTDGGITWSQLTNWWATVHTDMHQIVNNPYNNAQLYNMNDGGVWLSTDGGNNWVPKSDGLNGYEIYHGNCSPTRKDMMSIGTQDNGELYATSAGWFTNRGGDWGSQCSFDYRPNSSMVYYHQSNKRRLVTGSEQTYGLPARVTSLDDITFHRSNSNLAFVADSFIYRTSNLTTTTPTWTEIAALGKPLKAIHSSFADPNRLYVIANDATFYVSTNALSATPTFTMYTLPNTTNNDATITTIKSQPNTIYITCNTQVYKSINNGATWTNIKYNLPSVNHVRILADEYYTANELVFIASNNTVYYKTSAATNWTIYNTNLPSRTEAIDMSIFNDSTTNTALRFACYGRSVWETSINNLRAVAANFSADKTTPCIGVPVQFSDLSTGSITTRTWSFPGGTPATSTLSNPIVTYNSPGVYNVTLTVSDGITSNAKTNTNYISTLGASLPLSEGFEGVDDPPLGWKNIDNSTLGVTWAKNGTSGGFGLSTSSMMFDNYSWNNPGEKDEIYVKPINFSTFTSLKLKFDVAYQVFSGYSDSLAVLISTNCGATFTKVYQKGGTILSSAGSGGNNFVPTSTEWRTDSVDLNAYSGQSNVLIAFQNINGYGNKLYLDNINIISTCVAPTIPTISATTTNICNGQNTTLSITSGILNGATQWQWYSGSCGGTPVGTGTSITVSPSATTTYYARGEGGCVNSGTCASITINNNSTSTSSSVSACNTYTWSQNGLTYTTSGTYTHTNINAQGCVATNILNLTINISANTTINTTVFGSYLWPVNGQTYTISGVYTSTSLNANGCINTSTLNLIVNQLGVNMNLQNAVQIAPNIFEYDVMVTYSGNTSFALRGYACGINHTAGMNNGGNLSHSFISRDPSLSTLPPITFSYTASSNHMRLTTVTATAGNEVTLSPGVPVRVATMRITNTVNFPSNFNPNFNLQLSVVAGKTLCIVTGIVNPPNTTFTINAPGNNPTAGTLQLLSGTVTTPCFYLNPTTIFNSSANNVIPVSCFGGNNGSAQITLSGTAPNATAGTYKINGGAPITYNSSPISLSNLSAGSYTITSTSAFGCVSTTQVNITQPPLITGSSNVTACNSYTWNGITYTANASPTHTYISVSGCDSIHTLQINFACNSTLSLKLFIEGYYIGSSLMTSTLINQGIGSDPLVTDSITVELRNAIPPYTLFDSKKVILNTNGLSSAIFNSTSGSYFIVIKHRNGLQTWSAAPVSFGSSVVNYDFSNTSAKAYGANMSEVSPGVWAIYSGELNFDENIDLLDLVSIEADISNFNFGYFPSDINGDGNVDLLDGPIVESNINHFIFSSHP